MPPTDVALLLLPPPPPSTGQPHFVKPQRSALVEESATAPKDKPAIATDKKSNKVARQGGGGGGSSGGSGSHSGSGSAQPVSRMCGVHVAEGGIRVLRGRICVGVVATWRVPRCLCAGVSCNALRARRACEGAIMSLAWSLCTCASWIVFSARCVRAESFSC
jgi:hypothetical protein